MSSQNHSGYGFVVIKSDPPRAATMIDGLSAVTILLYLDGVDVAIQNGWMLRRLRCVQIFL